MGKIASFFNQTLPRLRLSKLFFYVLVILFPLGTRKIFLTGLSDFFGYHVFYNTFYLYLTDLIFFGLILAWLTSSLLSSPGEGRMAEGQERSQGNISREKEADKSARFVARPFMGIFHKILTSITHDKIYWFLGVFWLILATSLIVSRETGLGFYGLAKISQFMLIFAYARENFSINPPLRVRGGEGELFSRETSHNPSSPPLTLRGGVISIFWLILATLWFQAGLGIWQYVNQESAGLVILGEEYLRPGLAGVAKFVSHETLNPIFYDFFPYLSPISDVVTNLRAYGTLPHSNVLAGLLFVGIMVNLYLLYAHNSSQPPLTLRGGENISRETPPLSAKGGSAFGGKVRGGGGALLILGLSLILLTTGLVVTFSRFVWAITFLAIILWFILIFLKLRKPQILAMKLGRLKESFYRPKRLALVAGLLLIALGLNLFLFGVPIKDRLLGFEPDEKGNYSSSFEERRLLNQISWSMIKQNPILGVGLKNFVVEMDSFARERLLPYLHQPVHNIYLLIAAESGILALLVFVILLYYIVRRRQRSGLMIDYTLLIIIFGLLGIGLFDHYFWTIQQGQLAFWIMLGLMAGKSK